MLIDNQVKAAANRIPHGRTGIDPITIITIFSQVLPTLIDCLHRNDDVSSTTLQDRVKAMNEKDPKRLIKRVASNLRKDAKRSGHFVDKEDSRVLAKAIIDQTINGDKTEVFAIASNYIPINSED